MKFDFLKFVSDLGISYKYLVNGFIGAFVWSIYKKMRLLAAIRQILIGSLVAGYVTPLIAFGERIGPQYMSALSFVVGMLGMILVDSVYKYLRDKVKIFNKLKDLVALEKQIIENNRKRKIPPDL
jgi:uncharacterized membrane protein YeaQ/YmgE (transglycosylase-associated protein family)